MQQNLQENRAAIVAPTRQREEAAALNCTNHLKLPTTQMAFANHMSEIIVLRI